MQNAQQFQQSLRSLPAAGQPKRIVVPDKYGIDREMVVTDETLDYVRAIVQARPYNSTSASSTGYNFAQFVGPPSLGSLPSATSQASSVSSFGSFGQQQTASNYK